MPSRLTVVLVSLLLATPAVILWIWLLILPTTLTTQCPEKCECNLDGLSVNCSGSGLNSIPSILPTDVLMLVLDKNNLTYFQNDSFVSKGLVELEILYVWSCELREIELGAFNGLTKLTELSLQGNEISEIIPGTFEKINQLENLDLSYNRFEHFESDVFSGLFNLKYINLNGNKLQYLQPDTFIGLPNLLLLSLSENFGLQIPTYRHFIKSHSLKTLDISNCNVSSVSVETFANVSALEILDLSFNNLRSVDIISLKALPKLSELSLEHNKISEIIPGTFWNLNSLEYLDLGYNKIENLESDVFSGLHKLKQITLQGNRLQYLHPDTFSGLPNLQILFLALNFGLQIPTDRHFIKSHSLKTLSMSFCNVRSLSVKTFAKVRALESLQLVFNNLRSLDINILKAMPKISELYLYGNPLHCDCQLQEVWRWCQDHNIQTAYVVITPECDTPSEVNGIWWGVLEKGQCLEGNISYYGDYKIASYSYTLIDGIKKNTDREKKFTNNFKPYQLIVVAVFFLFGTTFNIILIIIITCNKDMRTVPNVYILNLAVSDIIILTWNLISQCGNSIPDFWQHEGILSGFLIFCPQLSVGLTTYSIAVFSIQRYRVTVNPLQVHVSSQPTWRSTVATICGVWIVAALIAFPFSQSEYLFSNSTLLYRANYYKLLSMFRLIGYCVLPLFVIAFSYTMTIRHLFVSSRPIPEETQNPQTKTRRNTAKVLLALTAVLLITYVPVHIYEVYYAFGINLNSFVKFPDEFVSALNVLDMVRISRIFRLLNPCLNPVALFCTSRSFRRHFKRYLTCCCKTNSPPTDFELTNRN